MWPHINFQEGHTQYVAGVTPCPLPGGRGQAWRTNANLYIYSKSRPRRAVVRTTSPRFGIMYGGARPCLMYVLRRVSSI